MTDDDLESSLQARLLKGLRQLGIWAIRMGRYRRRSATDPMPECGEDGIPDIWTPYGWLETKAKGGVLSNDQLVWHAKARRIGINVHVPRSVEDGIRRVLEWRRKWRGAA